MCGFFGAAKDKPLDLNSNWIKTGTEKIIHRGPDAQGSWVSENNNVLFAHNRLSIIDLSADSDQPFLREDLGLAIVFNGEIYNFKILRSEILKHKINLITSSDTEILLLSYHLWGEDFLKKIKGMFSFAIYDLKENKIIMARDIAGEKPLYYQYKDNTLYFASELKALIHDEEIPAILDPLSLKDYLRYGYVSGDDCILEGFKKLEAGSILIFDFEKIVVQKFWNLPNSKSNKRSSKDLIDELDSLLNKSIEQMLVADVPLGVLLSGGLDSSLIVAIASKISSEKINTFTISFPNNSSLDESQHAALIADYFGTNHNVLEANPDQLIEKLAHICSFYDEPIVDSSMLPTWLVTNLVSKHCKVAIGGDGGDELFGGYIHYSRLSACQKIAKLMPITLRRLFIDQILDRIPKGSNGRQYIDCLKHNLNKKMPIIARYFDSDEINLLLPRLYDFEKDNDFFIDIPDDLNGDIVQAATRHDFKNYLAEDILVKIDRASMSNSIELRAPFLHKDIIEFAFSNVPSRYKSSPFNKKILLKKLAKRYLPASFDYKRKQGFDVPIDEWLRQGRLRVYFEKIMHQKDCIFDYKYLTKLLEDHDSGVNNGERLFSLLQLQLWINTYDVDTKNVYMPKHTIS